MTASPVTEHTPTPWVYRPNEHDDWGWIRDADGNLAATARDGRVWSENLDRYRAAKTDPYGPNAAFIVKAVNQHAAYDEVAIAALALVTECSGDMPPSNGAVEKLCNALNALMEVKRLSPQVTGHPTTDQEATNGK